MCSAGIYSSQHKKRNHTRNKVVSQKKRTKRVLMHECARKHGKSHRFPFNSRSAVCGSLNGSHVDLEDGWSDVMYSIGQDKVKRKLLHGPLNAGF